MFSLKYTKHRLNLCKKKLKKEFFNPALLYDNVLLLFDYFTVERQLSKNNDVLPYSPHQEKASLQEKGHLPVKDIHHKISITLAGARFDFAS
jgi:hypothetical protein